MRVTSAKASGIVVVLVLLFGRGCLRSEGEYELDYPGGRSTLVLLVRDDRTGAPIADAEGRPERLAMFYATDSTGTVAFAMVAGKFVVFAHANGYAPKKVRTVVRVGVPDTVLIRLTRQRGQ